MTEEEDGEGFITRFDSFLQNAKKTWFLKQAPHRLFTLEKSKISLCSTKKKGLSRLIFFKNMVFVMPLVEELAKFELISDKKNRLRR